MPQPTQHAAPRARLTLALLALLSALAFMDRQILAVLLVPVKAEFSLSDLQVGLVTGLGFALAFGAIALPLGRLADRRERRTLVALCRGIGGALAALGAAANGAWTLAVTRMGSAISDAGGGPASLSMIADLFPPASRSRAMSVFAMGASAGSLMALIGGAWFAQRYGWRATLAAIGLGSLAVAVLLRYWAREPLRGEPIAAAGGVATAPMEQGAVRAVLAEPVARWLIVAAALALLAGISFGTWNFAYLVRVHGLEPEAVGWITGLSALGSVLGNLASGALADRLGALDMRWQPRLMAMGAALIALFGCAVSLLPSIVATAVALALFAACVAGLNGPTYALTQSLVAVRMRGLSMSTLVVLLNLIGVGVGPTMAGILSDIFAARYGADSVRWAMVCVLLLNLPAVWLFARAAHSIREDLV